MESEDIIIILCCICNFFVLYFLMYNGYQFLLDFEYSFLGVIRIEVVYDVVLFFWC